MKAKRRRSRKARDKDKPIDWSKAKRVRLPNLKPSPTLSNDDAAVAAKDLIRCNSSLFKRLV